MQTPGTESDRSSQGASPGRGAEPAIGPPPSGSTGARQAAGSRLLWTLVVLALAAGGYAWVDQRRNVEALRSDVAKRLTADDAALAQAGARESDTSNELRDAQAKLALLEARLGEFQSQQASLDALYRELAPSRDELALTEVEQILILASQQLALAGNVQAALTAMQVADSKLARLDRLQFGPLRRALAQDMDRLKDVPYVDVTGISIKLDQLIDGIDSLPLARDERLPPSQSVAPPASQSGWRRVLDDLWYELKDVIRVEVSDRPAAPLLTPQQTFFLRENLRLRLLGARLSLLSRDERAFKADLQAASAWLKQYFDHNAKPVQAALNTLAQQSAVTMRGEMPDLSRSLEAVRALRATTERLPDHPAERLPGQSSAHLSGSAPARAR